MEGKSSSRILLLLVFISVFVLTFCGGNSTGANSAKLNSKRPSASNYTQTNLVSSGYVSAKVTDPNLVNAWGIVMAPSKFGKYSDALLVGNFGNGEILAYRPDTSGMFAFEGVLDGTDGKPLMNGRLWDLSFGNGADGADPNTLYITTGGPNPMMDGLFAAITPSKS